jgi:ATP/maltotriose-dependent transcriptional regulator MalT
MVMGRKSELLVGRAEELGALERLLDDTRAGASNVVFLTGEPGIGKTHVLGELVRRAETQGCLVLEGSAAEFEQELPFGVVIDALDAYLASLDALSVDRLAADGLEGLADVFPSLRSLRTGAGATPTATERFRLYYAVRELLERLAARQPMVLVFDDLHWADGASIELVAHLIRRPPEAPVLLAGSFRTGQVSTALLAAIDAADRAGDVERIELGPLAPHEADTLLGDTDGARRQGLYRQSGGNPFYLLQLARARRRIGGGGGGGGHERVRDDAPDGGDAQVPPAVVSAIAQELASLSPSARAFAEAAAVVGDPFELDLATATADVAEPAALTCLDELIARDLVRPAQVPRRFQFRHPLVRAAVYESSPAGTRLAAHARCAGALAAQGAPATTRAHHVEQSARHGDPVALAVLLEAGEATAQRLPSSAGRWFQACLRLLPDTAPVEDRVKLVMAAASALTTAGRLNEARAVLLEGFQGVPRDAHELRVGLTAACAGVEQQIGRHDEAHNRLVAALEELNDRRSEAGVALMVALATEGFHRMTYGTMKTWGTEAVAAAAPLGNRMLLASAEAVLAMGCSFTLDREGAEEHCRAAARIVDAMADEELAVRLDAVGHLAGTELYLERFEETAVHAGRGVAAGRAAGRTDVFPTLFPCLGTAHWVAGRLAESIDVLDGAVEAARLTGNDHSVAWSLLNLSLAALMQGDLELALRSGQESVDLVGLTGDNFVSALAAMIYGWVLFESGEAARGAQIMVTGCGGDDLPRIPGGWRATYLEALVRCYLQLGRLDDARRAAGWAMDIADQVGLPRTSAMAHRAAAEMALHLGASADAVHHARQAVDAAERCSARVDAAQSRVVLGRALAQDGDVAGAAAELARAAADFDSYGATRGRDQAEQELRKLGHRVHRRSQPGLVHGDGLTALSGRELEVARLVVDRRTNPEIAADLFLSLKTVESHMRNIFRKLGVSSRVEVARVAERSPSP